MSNLDAFQQIYALSFAASSPSALVGPEWLLQLGFQNLLQPALDKTLPGWKVSWGPRIWKKHPYFPTGPDNIWFAATFQGLKYPDGSVSDTCVVAISGSAIFSKTDWVDQDFGVDNVTPFEKWASTWTAKTIPKPTKEKATTGEKVYSAYGTAQGVHSILSNLAPKNTPAAGMTVYEYLAALPSSYRVIFTGHSLGGALSPGIGLGLQSAGLLDNIQPSSNVLVLPSAGASPGDSDLSKGLYGKFFQPFKDGDLLYQMFNTDFFNKYDVVPQAWCTDSNLSPDRNLPNIITIYGDLPPDLKSKIEWAVNLETDRANSSGTIYIPLPGTEFQPAKTPKVPQHLAAFLGEVVYQHTFPYYYSVKGDVVNLWIDLYEALRAEEGLKTKNGVQAASDFPVTRMFTKPVLNDEEWGVLEGSYPYDDAVRRYKAELAEGSI